MAIGQSGAMKVLITGANGQVAQAMLAFAPPGYEVVALDRSQFDLADQATVEETIHSSRPDWVVNAGAYTQVDAAETDEPNVLTINAHAPRAIARALARTGGRLLQISSDYVFDGAAQRAYRPDDHPNPLSVYGRSKLLGEQVAGADALVVRTGWLYGARGRNFLRAMLARMQAQREVRVVADQTGTPTSTSSLALALWELMRQDANGIHHFRDGGEASWHEFARAIGDEALEQGLIGVTPQVIPIATADYPAVAQRPRYSVLDDTVTRRLLGIEPVHWRIQLRHVIGELAHQAPPP